MAISLCGLVGENTGRIDCDILRGNPLMIVAGSAIFDSGDYADSDTLKAAFLDRLKRNTGDSEKLFPFPVVQGTTDQTEAAKYGTLGYGLKSKLIRSKPGYEFDVIAGSSLEKKLIKFDGQELPLFIFDDKFQIAGRLDTDGNWLGAKWLVGVEPRPYGDAQNAKSTKITISLVDSADFVENAAFFLSDFSTADLVGLKDAVASEFAANSTNVFKIGYKIPTAILNGDINIFDTYGTAIAALTFTAKTGATFATTLAITSVAVDNTLKCLTVTFDSTAFTALASGAKIKLIPPTAAVLDAADVTGIELATIIVDK